MAHLEDEPDRDVLLGIAVSADKWVTQLRLRIARLLSLLRNAERGHPVPRKKGKPLLAGFAERLSRAVEQAGGVEVVIKRANRQVSASPSEQDIK